MSWRKVSEGRVRLRGFETWEETQMSATALLFGHMIEQAKDVQKRYFSDLYHDAINLERHLKPNEPFWWMVRESGTHLFFEEDMAKTIADIFSGDIIFMKKITVVPINTGTDLRSFWVADLETYVWSSDDS